QRQQFFDIELEEMVARVGEAYLLPDEIPTMHTVSDKSQLSNNLFYQKAENGDKVLVFKTADLAIIFRPSISKIINIDKASSLEVYDNLSNKLEQVGII